MMCFLGECQPREVLVHTAAAMRVELDQFVAGGLAVARQLVESSNLVPGSSPAR